MTVVKIKKQKAQTKCVIKKLKSENYKNCLEATPLENKLNRLGKKQIDVDSVKENHTEFIKTINPY